MIPQENKKGTDSFRGATCPGWLLDREVADVRTKGGLGCVPRLIDGQRLLCETRCNASRKP